MLKERLGIVVTGNSCGFIPDTLKRIYAKEAFQGNIAYNAGNFLVHHRFEILVLCALEKISCSQELDPEQYHDLWVRCPEKRCRQSVTLTKTASVFYSV